MRAVNDPEDHDPWFSSEDNQVVEYSVEPQFRLANVFPSMPQSGQSNKIVECGEYSPFDMRCNALICVLFKIYRNTIEVCERAQCNPNIIHAAGPFYWQQAGGGLLRPILSPRVPPRPIPRRLVPETQRRSCPTPHLSR